MRSLRCGPAGDLAAPLASSPRGASCSSCSLPSLALVVVFWLRVAPFCCRAIATLGSSSLRSPQSPLPPPLRSGGIAAATLEKVPCSEKDTAVSQYILFTSVSPRLPSHQPRPRLELSQCRAARFSTPQQVLPNLAPTQRSTQTTLATVYAGGLDDAAFETNDPAIVIICFPCASSGLAPSCTKRP